ncbi:hypothetical protein GCM10007380_17590 [Gottfriedia solisilvae]|uniref:Uncharacterized protein n=1 Tax=Gottfriedia solisilvae TaxID=1516104 RepID=A0A8J3AHE3_9BACI|nr:hypothetical protein GCM10007380_17590 [Gottfriedia solisilvae]
MKHLISALYISFGLLIVTLTYFDDFNGPEFLTGLGLLLVIVGIIPYLKYYKQIIKFHKEN